MELPTTSELLLEPPEEDLGIRAAVGAALFGDAASPVRLDRFEVRGTLGTGAMGVVYDAYDPMLTRRVALKVLKDEASSDGTRARRLLREAQSLATLSHPNVVNVFEAVPYQGSVCLVMEAVDGETLHSWQSKRRTWRDLVTVYLAAGAGLAAAHASGILHRDFKPDNVLISRDGSVRVADFGLALPLGLDPTISAGEATQPSTPARLTKTGGIAGTPAYMSPEQLRGAICDARSDQFSFCVALFEALLGQRPFAYEELAFGPPATLVPKRTGRSIPPWLRRAILRGLAIDPTDRWPDMPSLLAALRRGAARRRTFALGFTGVAVSAMSATFASAAAIPGCPDAPSQLETVWSTARRIDIADAFTATGVPWHREASGTAVRGLEIYAESWLETHARACEARASGTRSDSHYDTTMTCLDTRLLDFGSLVDSLLTPDSESTTHIEEIVATLSPAEDCFLGIAKDDDWAADSRQTHERILAAELSFASGHYEAARADAKALQSTTPLSGSHAARIAALEARALHMLFDIAPARTRYIKAISLANAAHLDDLSAALLRDLCNLSIRDAEDSEEAQTWLTLYQGAMERARGQGVSQASYLLVAAELDLLNGDMASAEGRLREAAHLSESAGVLRDADGIAIRVALATAIFRSGRRGEATALFEETIADRTAVLGADHPAVASLHHDLGIAAASVNAHDLALAHFDVALTGLTAAFGSESVRIAPTLVAAAQSHLALHHYDLARSLGMRAYTLQSQLPDNHTERYSGLSLIANIEGALGNHADELRLNKELLTYAQLAPVERAIAAHNVAWLLCEIDSCRGAGSFLHSSARVLPPDHPLTLYVQGTSARIDIAEGRPAAAREKLLATLDEARSAAPSDENLIAELTELLNTLPSSKAPDQ